MARDCTSRILQQVYRGLKLTAAYRLCMNDISVEGSGVVGMSYRRAAIPLQHTYKNDTSVKVRWR